MPRFRSDTGGRPLGIHVPPGEVELYLALGWLLADEPGCGTVRMFPPPTSSNFVNQSEAQAA